MYFEQPMGRYMEKLASRSPTPGGGSVAALVGALGAALISMVANFTLGKEKYKEVEEEVKNILEEAEEIRRRLSELVVEDTRVYEKVSRAYRMRKETEEEKKLRRETIQEALKEASEAPLEVLRLSYRLLELNEELVEKGNVNLISDVGVSVALAESALRSAYLNVEINLSGIREEDFVVGKRREFLPLIKEGKRIEEKVWGKVYKKVVR